MPAYTAGVAFHSFHCYQQKALLLPWHGLPSHIDTMTAHLRQESLAQWRVVYGDNMVHQLRGHSDSCNRFELLPNWLAIMANLSESVLTAQECAGHLVKRT